MEFQRDANWEKRLVEILRRFTFKRLRIEDPVILESVDSTQKFMSLVKKSSTEGDVVISKVQMSGMGREQRRWYSQEGGLWMTVTLTPPVPQIVADVPSVATKSIVRTLGHFGIAQLSIKPPNDVYSGGKKIAGVLADASIVDDESIVYLGMGVNLNNDPTTISELSKIATSAKLVSDKSTDVLEFAACLLENLDAKYAATIAHQTFSG